MSASDDRLSTLDSTNQILLKPKRAFELLDISRSTGYALLAAGVIPSIKIGRSIRVPVDGLKDWVKRQVEQKEAN